MTSVAIVGFAASSREQVHNSTADEIWSVNWAWQYNLPRIDRLFDMHPRWHLEHAGDMMAEHWAWLQREHTFPIYMLEPFTEVPNCVLYPIDEVLHNVGRPYFTSSVSYMLGLALLEGFDKIEVYGIDMGTSTEYAYQKAGTEYLLGMAEGRGIEVFVPKESKLLHAGLYGYDGGFQVIGRQTLEKFRLEYQKQFDQRLSQFNKAQGSWDTLKELVENEDNPIRKRQLEVQSRQAYQQFISAKDNLIAVDAVIQNMTHLIDEVDAKAPDLTIHNNVAVKV